MIAVLGLALDAAAQYVLDTGGQGGHQLAHGDKLVGRLIGALAGNQVVHGDAQGVDIGAAVGLGPAELLRGGVALGADVGGVRAGLLLVLPGDAEVDEL